MSRVLAESHLGSLFSYFGFQGRAFLSRVEVMSVSISSLVSVLVSFTFNTANLFTNSDWGTLFASHTKQNPPPGRSTLPLPLLHFLEPSSLRLIPPFVLQLTSGCPSNEDSPLQDGWPLCTNSILMEVESMFSELHSCPWVFL